MKEYIKRITILSLAILLSLLLTSVFLNKSLNLKNENAENSVFESKNHIEKYSAQQGNKQVEIENADKKTITTISHKSIPEKLATAGIYNYEVSDGNATVTGITDKYFNGKLSIPATLGGYPVTSISSYAFKDCKITAITIPDSVISIGSGAFSGCSSLAEITLPFVGDKRHTAEDKYQYPFGYIFGTSSYTGGTSITQYYYGNDASRTTNTTYYIPSSLKKVTITDYDYIPYGAFYNCANLKSITIPDSVTSISSYAFFGCSSLTEITLPFVGDKRHTAEDKYQYPFGYVFGTSSYTGGTSTTQNYCWSGTSSSSSATYYIPSSLRKVTITDCEYIQYGSFYNCSNLTSIILPETLISISNYAFYSCSKLSSITIPDSLISIGSYAFSGCAGLNKVNYTGSIADWCKISFSSSYSNPLYHANSFYINDVLVTDLVIPDDVTSIGNYAFNNCTSFTSVKISDSVDSIGNYAFSGCTGLTSVALGNSITSIGNYSFSGCTGLISITIPGSVESISSSAFDSCTIKNLIISEGLETLTSNFIICRGTLEKVTVPDSVTLINRGSFYGCSSLTEITLPFAGDKRHTAEDTYQYPFGYIFGVSSYTEGTSTKQYYYGSDNLSSTSATYYIPSSLKKVKITDCDYIPYGAFYNCINLTSITLPDTLISIGDNAFYSCSKLSSIIIPDAVISVGNNAFSGCTGITSVTVPNSTTTIGMGAFSGCSSLTRITLPFVGDKRHTAEDTYQYPFGYVFGTSSGISTKQYYYGSDNLSSTSATYYIPSSLKKVTITDCEYIQYGAFYNCSNLTSVTIPDSVTSIGESAFTGCSSLYEITLPFVGDKRHTAEDTYQYPFGYVFGTSSGMLTTQYYYGSDTSRTTYTNYCIPSSLKKVTITDCEYIQYGAFYNCSNLTSVTIPDSVASIGGYAFSGCSGLGSVTIPDLVTVITEGVFNGCRELKSIEIPETITSIGDSAFYGCTGLKSIEIPETVTSIGYDAFYRCSGLESILVDSGNKFYSSSGNCLIKTNSKTLILGCNNSVIPDDGSVVSIGRYAFYGCTELETITIPDSITNVEYDAFYGCTGLKSIEIPETVTSIGTDAFYRCSGLESILVDSGNKFYSSSGNCLIETNGKTLILGCNNSVIPDDGSVVSIGRYAFYGCTGLETITIPDSVTYIDGYAFYGCTGLNKVNYTGSLEDWCGISFSGSSSNPLYYAKNLYIDDALITNLVVPDGVTSIGNYAFYNCTSFTSVKILDSVDSIGDYAFSGCTGLTSVDLGSSVTSIGNWTFSDCSGLTSIKIPDLVTSIGYGAFCNCVGLELAVIPDLVTSIGNNAFYGCTNLKSIKIPGSVVSIGNYAFYGCTGLESIEIPEKVTSIGDSAFNSCTNLESITIPDSVASIGRYAFSGCTRLKSIKIPNLVTVISKGIFNDCSGLKSIEMGSSVTDIGDYAFSGCTGLTSITIPGSIKSIGFSAFYPCKIKNLIFSDGLETLTSSFIICKSTLEKVTIPDTVTSIDSGVFSGCTSLTEITLPFVGDKRHAVDDTYQYPFGYVFGTSNYTGSTSTTQYYYGSDTSSGTSTTYYIPSSLNKVTITGCEYMPYGAFYNCKNLTSVTIGSSVTDIGYYAFEGCTGLNKVLYTGSVADWCDISFSVSTSNPLCYAKNLYIDDALITNLVVPDGVTSIGDYAFYNCTKLNSVTLSDSLISIGKYAFNTCSTIKSLTIPDSVTSIGEYAFYGCTGLSSVALGNSVTDIGYCAFLGCTGLNKVLYTGSVADWCKISFANASSNPLCYAKNLYIDDVLITDLVVPDGVTSIGDYAFYNCTNLTSVTFSDSATLIGNRAFYNCTKLTSITLSDSVISIGEYAFSGCSGFTSITIPDSVNSIGEGAFSGCSSLTEITLPFVGDKRHTADDTYQYPFGYVFGTSKYTGSTSTTQYYYGNDTSRTTSTAYYIPSSLKKVTVTGCEYIPYGAFNNCTYLKSVIIGNSVTGIGNYAFSGCTGLNKVLYTGSVADWCKISFANASSNPLCYAKNLYIDDVLITDLVVPDDVTSIGNYAFYNCTNLTSVTFSDSVTSIGNYAFNKCSEIKLLTIPDSVTSIEEYAFSGCTGLNKVLYTGSMADWCNISFGNSGSNPLCYAHDFYINDEPVTDLVIPDGVTSIGDYAFYNCTNLTSVTFSDSVTSIGNYAFNKCSEIKLLTIPDSVASIGEGAFSGCSSLTEITLPFVGDKRHTAEDTYQYPFGYIFGTSSYTGGTSATQYYYQGSTSSSSGTTYYMPLSLKTVTVTDCDYIPYGAFYNCTNLTLITLPDTLISIGDNAFYNCSELPSITIPDSVTSIGENAFSGCAGLNKVNYTGSISDWCRISFANTGSNPLYYANNLYINDILITDLVIPNGVTTIAKYAFYNCTGVESVLISDSVKRISEYAFYNCSKLENVLYAGTEKNKEKIEISYDGNGYLFNATWHYASISNFKEPTCTEKGYTGDMRWDGYDAVLFYGWETSPLGHDFGEWIQIKVPTCTENGTEMRVCSRDDSHTETRDSNALGHDYEAVITKPTCTDYGYTTYTCSRCGSSYVDNYTDPLGHTGGTATCHSRAICEYCGIEYGEFDSNNHNGKTEVRNMTSAKCTTNGYTGDTYCLDCGEMILAGDIVPATGHTAKWSTITMPTMTEAGSKRGICLNCGETIAEEIPALCMTYDVDNAKQSAEHNILVAGPVNSNLPETVEIIAQIEAISEDSVIYETRLENEGVEIQPTSAVLVGIPVPDGFNKDKLSIYRRESDGKKTRMDIIIDGDFVYFETRNFGIYEIIEKIRGDINDDNSVDNKDLTRLFQYLSKWDGIEVNEKALDVNGDGSVDNKDLTRLFQYLSNWDVEIF